MKLLFIYIIAICGTIWAYTDLDFTRNHNFGTNLDQEIQVASPGQLGKGIIQARYQFSLDWIEPVFSKNSDSLTSFSTYLRSKSLLETTPYYFQFKSGIGIQPIPLFEVSIHYSNLFFYGSNVALPVDKHHSNWDENYISEQIYNDPQLAFIQTVHMVYSLFYSNNFLKTMLMVDHQLIDITSKERIYYYDYSRLIPVYPRDDLFEMTTSVSWIVNPYLDIFLQNKFLLTNFEGNFSNIFDPNQAAGKPILYRNDIKLGLSYCVEANRPTHSFYSWLGFSEQSKGPKYSFMEKLSIGIAIQKQINFKEYSVQ